MFEVAPPRPCSPSAARGLPPQIGRSAASGGDLPWGSGAQEGGKAGRRVFSFATGGVARRATYVAGAVSAVGAIAFGCSGGGSGGGFLPDGGSGSGGVGGGAAGTGGTGATGYHQPNPPTPDTPCTPGEDLSRCSIDGMIVVCELFGGSYLWKIARTCDQPEVCRDATLLGTPYPALCGCLPNIDKCDATSQIATVCTAFGTAREISCTDIGAECAGEDCVCPGGAQQVLTTETFTGTTVCRYRCAGAFNDYPCHIKDKYTCPPTLMECLRQYEENGL